MIQVSSTAPPMVQISSIAPHVSRASSARQASYVSSPAPPISQTSFGRSTNHNVVEFAPQTMHQSPMKRICLDVE